MPQLYTDLDKFFRVPIDDRPIPVRILTLIPDRALVHVFQEGRRWIYWGCDRIDCEGCRKEIVKPTLRWRYDFSTEDGTKELWAAPHLHRQIEEYQVRLGNDLFLMTDFLISREPRPMPTYVLRVAGSERI